MAQLRFSLDDQRAFAAYSGDRNPIHIDPLFARRTMAGQPVVHGVNILLSAAEAALAGGLIPPLLPTKITAAFRRPLLLDETADVRVEGGPDSAVIKITVGSVLVAQLDLARFAAPIEAPVMTLDDSGGRPRKSEFSVLSPGTEGRFALACGSATLHPRLEADWGRPAAAALASLSRLVGMEVPGLESMLSAISLSIDGPIGEEFRYRVTAQDERFRRLEIEITAAGLKAAIVAFAPRTNIAQPSMSEVVAAMTGDRFPGRHALIVGGSRGLGEVAAKALAAAGARVTLTYARGRDEAERVAAEINAFANGAAECLRLDATEDLKTSPLSIEAAFDDVTSIYYMATPRIFAERRRSFDPPLYRLFSRIYLEFPAELIARFGADRASRAFVWPSTIAVETAPAGAAEYAVAKAAGEKFIEIAAKIWPNLRFFSPRLPRIETDQTIALAPTESTAVLDVVPDLVRQVETAIGESASRS